VVRPEAGRVRLGGVERVRDDARVDEGLLTRVVGGEGDVRGGVPVLGADAKDEGGQSEEGVDQGDDGAAVGDREGAVLGERGWGVSLGLVYPWRLEVA
jgi:hypothetical protein